VRIEVYLSRLVCTADCDKNLQEEKERGLKELVGVCGMEQFLVLSADRKAARWIGASVKRKNRERRSFCEVRLAIVD
jgi:hypothetical protein